ncbi:GNAT family N-acetyltransferase [Campylobacter sp. CS_ED1]|uniref:GNAT family N-acetyltransferase n=1 Tax=Campylobacter sp. CS_ED1 TaxID=2984140 RepID=UPI00359C2849
MLKIDKQAKFGELELLFISPNFHSKGIGKKAWQEIEKMHPEIKIWQTCTPYFEKRNIHFYLHSCGFKIIEFYNKFNKDPNFKAEFDENGNEICHEMFLFEKIIL